MDKAKRLELLKRLGEKHAPKNDFEFGELQPTEHDIKESVGDMDAFRENLHEHKDVLTSDER